MGSIKSAIFYVKKGPADPFRGSWYTIEKSFSSKQEAVEYAANLTLDNHHSLPNAWDQYGYEWSVFENDEKIWEGFKFIQHMLRDEEKEVNLKNGFL